MVDHPIPGVAAKVLTFQAAIDRLLLDGWHFAGFDASHRLGRTWKDTASDIALVFGAGQIPTDIAPPATATPPVGMPLTVATAKLLRPGDVLRPLCVPWQDPAPVVVRSIDRGLLRINGRDDEYFVDRFAFIGRPDAAGWIPWAGGACPLPDDTMIEARMRNGGDFGAKPIKAQSPFWEHRGKEGDIVAFRIRDLASTAQPATAANAALPPVGVPLTPATADLLQPGDLLRSLSDMLPHRKLDDLITTIKRRPFARDKVWYLDAHQDGVYGEPSGFAFIGRPDADGWIPWAGGDCPLPGGTVIDVRLRTGTVLEGGKVESLAWDHVASPHDGGDIVAFRIRGVGDAAQPAADAPAVPPSTPFGAWQIPSINVIDVKGVAAFRESLKKYAADLGIVGAADAPKQGDPVEPPFGAKQPTPAKITISPHSVEKGDRVRVTFEAEVGVKPDDVFVSRSQLVRLASAHRGVVIELLERPEKPLAVGDPVIGPYGDEVGHIRHIAQGIAAVEFPNDFRTIALDDLGRG